MQKILNKIKNVLHKEYISYRYRETVVEDCHCCGTLLETPYNTPLKDQFIMDVHGNFYCHNCGAQFKDGDGRIYSED